MKKIKNNNKSKARVFGTLLIAILVIAASFTVLFLIPQSPLSIKPVSAAYGDFSYHKKITINHTKVSGALSDFPVWVYTIDTDFRTTGNGGHINFDNASDIAFFSLDNNTQYNHEIELFVPSTGELGVWVNITSISSSANTEFYIYYGDSDKSTGHNHNPTSVWDSDFKMVLHLNETTGSYVYDSTSNDNNGSYNDSLPTRNTNIGPGYSQEFDGTGDYIGLLTTVDISATGTVEIIGRFTDTTVNSGSCNILFDYRVDSNDNYMGREHSFDWRTQAYSSNVEQWHLRGDDDADNFTHYHGWSWATNDFVWWMNDSSYGTDSSVTTISGNPVGGFTIGGNSVAASLFYGNMSEVRASNIRRSNDWMNATYWTCLQPSSFLFFGTEQADSSLSTFTLYGLTNNRVTFAGTAGNSYWCNSSGDGNEYLRENISANTTDNVTDILVHVDDLNDTYAWINASNIELFVSSDNSTYGSMGSFTDGGSNISVNGSTWPGGGGTNPFTDGAGIINRSVDIYFLFKMTFPADSPDDEFYTAAIDTCWIKPGYYT